MRRRRKGWAGGRMGIITTGNDAVRGAEEPWENCAARRPSISPGESLRVSSMVSKMDLWSALQHETERERTAGALGPAVSHDA